MLDVPTLLPPRGVQLTILLLSHDIIVGASHSHSMTDQSQSYTASVECRKFLEEALRMREFEHANILRLIGIALDKEDMPLVVLPFMKHGDLLSYIRNENNVSFSLWYFCSWRVKIMWG